MERKSLSRRNFMKAALGGLGIYAMGGCSLSAMGGFKKKQRPNIIFLLTDDQRWDTMGCMGNKIIKTPNMDKMAHNGVLFTNAFVTTSICCTSRASIFSGQYARRHNINDFSTPFSQAALAQTYPMQLRNAGYRIGFIGKYGVGPAKDFPDKLYDYWRGIPGQPTYEHKDEQGNYKHLTQIMGEQSLEFLQGCSQDKPFCLSVSFKAPHVQDSDPRQFIYDPAYKDLYKDVNIPLPQTATLKALASLPPFLKDERTETRVRWHRRFETPQMYQDSVKGYYRLITGVDVVIGRIRDELKRLDLDDNTIIILIGDNGFFLSEHEWAGKWYGYEESIRVPLVIYDPRLPSSRRGQVRKEMALNIDIAPTILSLAGANIPERMQGRDLTTLIEGKQTNWREDFFYEHLFEYHPRGIKMNAIPKTEGVVTKRFKYLSYPEQEPIYEQLFDLKNDPHEEKNLAQDPKYQDTLIKLRQRCDEFRQSCK